MDKASDNTAAVVKSTRDLLDALIVACDRQIKAQKAHLVVARDLLQQHYEAEKQPEPTNPSTDFARCSTLVVRAYQESTGTYAQLLPHLISTTGPTQGTNSGHGDLKHILKNVKGGRYLAEHFLLEKEVKTSLASGESEKDKSIESLALNEEVEGLLNAALNNVKPQRPNRKRSLKEDGSAGAASTKKHAKRKLDHVRDDTTDTPHQTSAAQDTPEIEYEDVSIEAAQRRREREAAKAARKAEKEARKKRKRESTGSNVIAETSLADLALEDRPKKKRSKKDGVARDTTVSPVDEDVPVKRKKEKQKEAHDPDGSVESNAADDTSRTLKKAKR